jgi:chromosome segregation ATPase
MVALAAAAALIAGLQWAAARKEAAAALARAASLEKENRDAAARAAQLQTEVEALRAQLLEKGIEPVKPQPVRRTEPDVSGRVETVRELTRVQGQLQAAEASVKELSNRVRDLEEALDKSQRETKRLAAGESELRDTLDSTRRLLQATETELKTKTERALQLETAVRLAQQEAAASKSRASQVAPVLREMEEINRRRENYIVSLQRRYRDLSDHLRSIAVRMDTQRDSPGAAAPDVSRIMSTVQSAEDDLRQLGTLNAQAQRVAGKLEQK